eukprot:CAMPEP_0178392132 /NCGR_PEP_ID=MMETSP0689_2-20121128/11521_1 /TAXON_ID=160604 /ORGANISM="Amphidinium massartii, Strain CS-259" /LENGTH=102 /DNA_ID=CAMNT_0020012697 /DNA_START=398 /DNA_END=703 /DNA_ORIENTATION=+
MSTILLAGKLRNFLPSSSAQAFEAPNSMPRPNTAVAVTAERRAVGASSSPLGDACLRDRSGDLSRLARLNALTVSEPGKAIQEVVAAALKPEAATTASSSNR